MQVTPNELLQVIGEQSIHIRMLETQLREIQLKLQESEKAAQNSGEKIKEA